MTEDRSSAELAFAQAFSDTRGSAREFRVQAPVAKAFHAPKSTSNDLKKQVTE